MNTVGNFLLNENYLSLSLSESLHKLVDKLGIINLPNVLALNHLDPPCDHFFSKEGNVNLSLS